MPIGRPAFRGEIQAICNGNKIQAIYRRKCAPITMQGLAAATEKPPSQEQEKTMKKTGRRTMETVGHPGACLRPVVSD
jgi:hypothetical protein